MIDDAGELAWFFWPVTFAVTLAVGCGDTREPFAWHLAIAAAVFVAGASAGAIRRAGAS